MNAQTKAYPTLRVVLGGILFGIYYTLGLAYFGLIEQFLLGMQQLGLGDWAYWKIYLPTAGILISFSVLTAMFLFGGWRIGSQTLQGWKRWILLPLLAYVAATLCLFAYLNLSSAAKNEDSLGFLSALFMLMAAVGILPLQVVLIMVPQRQGQANPAEMPRPISQLEPTLNADAPLEPTIPAPPEPVEAPAPHMFVLEANQAEPQFSIRSVDLIAIEAADNYCKIHFLKEGQRKTKTLRLKMKEAEEALQGAPGFYRCHRSFLVNAAMVAEVMGNSQAYRLRMLHMEEAIPVSRSFDVEPLRKTADEPR